LEGNRIFSPPSAEAWICNTLAGLGNGFSPRAFSKEWSSADIFILDLSRLFIYKIIIDV
jgi:hypothetical protein